MSVQSVRICGLVLGNSFIRTFIQTGGDHFFLFFERIPPFYNFAIRAAPFSWQKVCNAHVRLVHVLLGYGQYTVQATIHSRCGGMHTHRMH